MLFQHFVWHEIASDRVHGAEKGSQYYEHFLITIY